LQSKQYFKLPSKFSTQGSLLVIGQTVTPFPIKSARRNRFACKPQENIIFERVFIPRVKSLGEFIICLRRWGEGVKAFNAQRKSHSWGSRLYSSPVFFGKPIETWSSSAERENKTFVIYDFFVVSFWEKVIGKNLKLFWGWAIFLFQILTSSSQNSFRDFLNKNRDFLGGG